MRKQYCLTGIMIIVASMCFCGCGKDEDKAADASAEVPGVEFFSEEGASSETAGVAESNSETLYESMSKEEKTEITKAILDENNLNSSRLDNSVKTMCTFEVPEGFIPYENNPNFYVTDRFPIDASNIYYTELDADLSAELISREKFATFANDMASNEYGLDITVNIDDFEKNTLSGYPAYKVKAYFDLNEQTIYQTEYIILAEKTYIITYSQTAEYDMTELYETSADTIQVTKAGN